MQTEIRLELNGRLTLPPGNGHSLNALTTDGVDVSSTAKIAKPTVRSYLAEVIRVALLGELGALYTLRGTGVEMSLVEMSFNELRITQLEHWLGKAYSTEGKPIPPHPFLR